MRASCVGFVWPGDRCGWLSAYSALCFDPSPIHLGHNMADSSSGLVLNQAMMWCWHCVCSREFNIHFYPIKWCQFMSGSVPSVSFVTLNHECHFLTLPHTRAGMALQCSSLGFYGNRVHCGWLCSQLGDLAQWVAELFVSWCSRFTMGHERMRIGLFSPFCGFLNQTGKCPEIPHPKFISCHDTSMICMCMNAWCCSNMRDPLVYTYDWLLLPTKNILY